MKAGAAVSVFAAKWMRLLKRSWSKVGDNGDSVAATHRSSRTTKPTAKLQEKLQVAEKKTDTIRNMWSQQSLEGGSEGENGPADRVGESLMMGDAMGNDVSLMRTMLRGMLQETSTRLMSEQKQMLERLWDALMGISERRRR
jgi:hypothetical protein